MLLVHQAKRVCCSDAISPTFRCHVQTVQYSPHMATKMKQTPAAGVHALGWTTK